MKKFSTIACLSVLAAVLGAPAGAANAGTTAPPARCGFLDGAPDQHVVARGDTLWGIAGKFLQHPWCWPQVWGMNREQIRNPHWIYPGQIVYLDRAAGRLRLAEPAGGAATGAAADERRSPRVRSQPLGADAIPAIPASAIEPFLSQPLVVDDNQLQGAPHIVATQEGRVYLGRNDKAYVRGDLAGAKTFQVFRPGKPLLDPDSRAILGYEAAYLGDVQLERAAGTADEAHTFIVTNSKQEMGAGDRLLPRPPTPLMNYVPHAPAVPVMGRVISIYGGVTHAGNNQIVAINRGAADGIDVGATLELSRFGDVVLDRDADRQPVKLPDERYGSLFVFRVFPRVSYGLIMQVTNSVQVGDLAGSPE